MHARTRATLTLLAASLALTVTACGGDDKKAAPDKPIPGVDTSTSASAPASPTPSTAGGPTDRPKITLPDDVKNVFEGSRTGDPKKDEAVADAERRIDAVSDAILKSAPNSPALAYYDKPEMLVGTSQYVDKFAKSGSSYTGTIRYFKWRVSLVDDHTTSVVYCGDETKAFKKDLKTGKITQTTPSKTDYVLYNFRLTKNAGGVWQTSGGFSERGAASCNG
ncbi:hypothetical protein [Streptomyces sp. NPDC060031]|uniref:hypothetical protein n=1 Tax=Streptomyces sp. NPDC060031 TaxID=3347043 RepID=UPI0036A7E8C0